MSTKLKTIHRIKLLRICFLALFHLPLTVISVAGQKATQPFDSLSFNIAQTATGRVAGASLPGNVHVFRGIPYAAPPTGNLRWRPPVAAASWDSTRPSVEFGPHPMQPHAVINDFRSKTMSEDCLYLNIWSGAVSSAERLPVYIFIHGGAFIFGDGSQPAYDGESMAREGIVYITINYRLGIFGFNANAELTAESPHHASGNYGLLDQAAAIRWVYDNISNFGGDPKRITIGGESAGSFSVSGLMASPLAKDLIAGAISQSGTLLDIQPLIIPLAEAEKDGALFMKQAKCNSLAALRALSSKDILKVMKRQGPGLYSAVVDGYFLPKFPAEIFATGEEAHVPLLAGWNAEEIPGVLLTGLRRPLSFTFLFGFKKTTPERFQNTVRKIYGENAAEVLKVYPAATNAEAAAAATALESDRIIAFGSWRIADQHVSNRQPVYRYLFAKPHPPFTKTALRDGNFVDGIIKKKLNKFLAGTARHAAEIEYTLGTLDSNHIYEWTGEDYATAKQTQSNWINFIKTGNPNGVSISGGSLVPWPALQAGDGGQIMHLDFMPQAKEDNTRKRYLVLQQIGFKKYTRRGRAAKFPS